MQRRISVAGGLYAAALLPLMTLGRPMTFDDLLACKRLSDPKVSPDGKWVAYVAGVPDKGENRVNSDLWLVPTAGGTPRQLTRSPKHDRHPTWSPDSKWIAFESNRDGEFQVYVIPVDGGEARKLTTISTEANQPVWSPDGRHVAFVSAVFPEFSEKPFAEADRLNKEKLEGRDKSKVKARVITRLLYRHWDSWVDDKRQHLFVVPMKDGASAGEPKDLTPGDRDAVPTSSTFSAGDEFDFSPDGRELTYTATPTPAREEAWSTNHDLWTVDIATGERRQRTPNLAADGCPHYSPDGRWIAYRAQARAGFEADRWQLMLLDRAGGASRSLTAGFDSSVEEIEWTADSRTLVIAAEDKGTKRLWTVTTTGNDVRPITVGGAAGEPSVTELGMVYYMRHQMSSPASLLRVPLSGQGAPEVVVDPNAALIEGLGLPAPESVTVAGAGGTPVQMWILKPPGFSADRKWPLVFWVHGGPQGAFMDSWSYRWNPELWAAQGYVIAMPNPRGSTGFGQKFTDEISGDWGGKVYDDLMAALGHLEKQPWVDTSRMAAAGASFGGYMMNWFQGHTDKFKTLVTHCGVYNFDTMRGATDEVWFVDWEYATGGKSYDDRHSPDRFVDRFKTPMLIIQNVLDYRIPVEQGFALFGVLQRKGIDSRLVCFPDEGHWVVKPQNSELWHREVFTWLERFIR